ncbi:porin [Vibrio sp. ZSDE26]|uniref:Porin n=1 Tax=Vibrio amylolyticus TaxID=2847292 RepID=A0A9X1XJQ1_9VIBR|nr:porin [Vibrio amylolyticus]MCK6264016.1 porin [Vibrio amylolyticus]
MKKAVIASAVLSALMSGSALAATVYNADGTKLSVGGRAEFRGDFTDSVEGTMKDSSRARVNVKGSTEISDGLSAFGVWEGEQKTGGNTGFANRYLYAGIGTDIGKFSVGRQDMAAVIVSDMTDITEFSGIQQYIGASSDKEDSVFAYRGSFDALQVEATYQADSAKDNDAYSVAGMYSLPMGLDLGLAYSSNDKGSEDNSEGNQILAGIGYTFQDLYVAGTFSAGDVEKDVEFTAYELAASYKITSEFSVAALYGFAEQEVANVTFDTVDMFELAAYYKFNSNFRTYVAYEFDQLENADDTLRLGARYDF